MSEDFGNDFITLTDDEGVEYQLEHMDTLEHEDVTYMAFIPADADTDAEEIDFIILKSVEEDGEEVLVTLESDEEMEKVYELFMQRLENCEDEECECCHAHGAEVADEQ